MKYKVIIKKETEIIFDGKPIDLPIKKDILKQKSLEMFGEEELCIIHKVFVIQYFCDALISKFKDNLDKEIKISEYIEEVKFIDIKDIEQATLILRRK